MNSTLIRHKDVWNSGFKGRDFLQRDIPWITFGIKLFVQDAVERTACIEFGSPRQTNSSHISRSQPIAGVFVVRVVGIDESSVAQFFLIHLHPSEYRQRINTYMLSVGLAEFVCYLAAKPRLFVIHNDSIQFIIEEVSVGVAVGHTRRFIYGVFCCTNCSHHSSEVITFGGIHIARIIAVGYCYIG